MYVDEGAWRMKKQVYIAPQTISTEEKSGFPQDISFWQPLWEKFSWKAATMEIHCWTEEHEIQEQLGVRMMEIGQVRGTKTIAFKIELTEATIDWISNESFDTGGGLKWFSIFLYDALGELVLIVGHYGGEIVFYPEEDREIEEIRSFFKGKIIVNISE